jgi:dipeptidyl aminopeptidase/acylaminoacyl peptidase
MAWTPVRRLALAVLLLSLGARAEPPLIPREVLFGNPERTRTRLSPDGKRLAWLQPQKGVLQIWVQTLGKDDAAPITGEGHRQIAYFEWAQDGRSLIYGQDADGDENWHLYTVSLDSKAVRDLTPFEGVRSELVADSRRRPSEILVAMNRENRSRMDVYRVDLRTGTMLLDTRNPGTVIEWAATDDFQVRAGLAGLPDGGQEILVRDGPKAPWRSLTRVGPEDTLLLLDLTADGRSVLYVTSVGGDTSRIVQRAFAGGREKTLASNPEVDPGDVWIHPSRHVVQGVVFEPALPAWTLLDPTVKKDFDLFPHLARGLPQVVSRDHADGTWIVAFEDAQGPRRYFSFDRTSLQGRFLFSDRPALDPASLAEVKPVRFAARDRLPLRGYLTRPIGASGAGPLVLRVHGGPWLRDSWRLDPEVQWLANRGYSVLQVNFRGSSGYGRKFLNTGNRQWGKAMQNDLLDAVDWAVREGVADRTRVAIYGAGYGGYATLAAAAFSPVVFRCGVEVAGPSNLVTYLRNAPAYLQARQARRKLRVGDPDDEADKAMLESVSPLFSADKIRMPLLVAQGANDPRVKQVESEQIVAALEKNGVPVVYALYPDEAHGFARPENEMDFHARAEAFLAQHLGGRAEPLQGDRVPGSTAVVKVVPARTASAPK